MKYCILKKFDYDADTEVEPGYICELKLNQDAEKNLIRQGFLIKIIKDTTKRAKKKK